MKCPECDTKLSTKHYDAAFEWYECPKCEGCFTYGEIIEGGIDESNESENTKAKGNSGRTSSKKTGRGRCKSRKDTDREDTPIQARNGNKGPVAKGKKRRTEIEEDEAVIAEYEAEISKPIKAEKDVARHRDELSTGEVIGIWGDEIQEVYEELGSQLDEVNARDKALIIWRELRYVHGTVAREQEVDYALCKNHK